MSSSTDISGLEPRSTVSLTLQSVLSLKVIIYTLTIYTRCDNLQAATQTFIHALTVRTCTKKSAYLLIHNNDKPTLKTVEKWETIICTQFANM